MAILIVKRDYQGWKAGDHVEAFDKQKDHLISVGICDLVKDDPEPIKIDTGLPVVKKVK